jgi:hypothetical protein
MTTDRTDQPTGLTSGGGLIPLPLRVQGGCSAGAKGDVLRIVGLRAKAAKTLTVCSHRKDMLTSRDGAETLLG